MNAHTPTPLRVNVCRQSWHVLNKPFVALVFRGSVVVARGFGDSEEEATSAALAKVQA